MTDNKSDPDPKSDLAYVRAMTERAARAPLLGGRFLLLWGGLLVLTYLGHFAVITGFAGLPVETLAFLWPAFGIFGALGTVLLSRNTAPKPGAFAVGNVVQREIWQGAGLGILLFVIGVILATMQGASPIMFDMIAAVALALYGAAFLATAAASQLRWMRVPAWISFFAAAGVPLLAGSSLLYLALAGVVVLVSVVPGLILMRHEPPALHTAEQV
ncbi:hypothetical protein [Maritalea mediterranea]|uniref:Uncharacterized protein n=1 Tax=Maritalea mediterranea TaxID=2909667 RepID=A0ABS9E7X9_9HYPH|nr:hypothetical protein [Maritalea mediterranea]MCF4097875.1 hypothetical protein [Maritalea mediterranea]